MFSFDLFAIYIKSNKSNKTNGNCVISIFDTTISHD